MIDNLKNLDRKIRDEKIWKQDEIFDTIWNDKIDKFFENYKQFDEFLLSKSDKVLEFSGRFFLIPKSLKNFILIFMKLF